MAWCVVGVDVGGTKTRVCVLDKGARLLGCGLGGPGNPNFSPTEVVRASVHDAAIDALRDSGVSAGSVVLGAVGGPCPPEYFEPALRSALGDELELFRAGEGPITLAAGTRDEHGVVVVAGTGALAWGRNRAGATHFASGWGSLLGDEGSAYDVAVQGMRAACRAADGRGPSTLLLDRYRSHFGVADLRQIVAAVYRGGLDRRAIAATCPVVFEAARDGDTVARLLLGRAAAELALGAVTCARSLRMENDEFDVVASGGVLRSDDFVFPRLRDILRRRCPDATVVRPYYDPAVGAALLALKQAGVDLDDDAYCRLEASILARAGGEAAGGEAQKLTGEVGE